MCSARSVEESKILNRSSLFTVFLLLAITVIAAKTYRLWQQGPWDLPSPGERGGAPVSGGMTSIASKPQLADTKVIIEKNLFDPDRGMKKDEKENDSDLAATQRIHGLTLIGTAILGEDRYAILVELSQPGTLTSGRKTGQPVQLRLKLGDTVDGFTLSEIEERKVVFSKGERRVEIQLDYLGKTPGLSDSGRTGEQGFAPPPPAVRRDRLPPPPLS